MELKDKLIKSFSTKKLWKIFQITNDNELKQKISNEFDYRDRMLIK